MSTISVPMLPVESFAYRYSVCLPAMYVKLIVRLSDNVVLSSVPSRLSIRYHIVCGNSLIV